MSFRRRDLPALPSWPLLGLVAALAVACGDGGEAGEPGYEDCSGDRCASVEDKAELLAAIEGFEDPISAYLREAVREDGSLGGDYRDVLDGLLAGSACATDSERSFVVLSNKGYVPRSIVTHCSDSPQEASRLFVLLPETNFEHEERPRVIHMTAWDETAGLYRRFATLPRGEDAMEINVEPAYCLDCHGGPQSLGLWMPLMNEMTNPWSQWNAEPGFRSHLFDELAAPGTQDGLAYQLVSEQGLLDSASNFEPIIRSAIDRVTGARAQKRRDPAQVEQALELLRPLFCDEGINYVSEIHGSGEIRSSVLVDDALRGLFEAAGLGDGLDYLQEKTIRLPEPATDADTLRLVPVRGEATLRMELALVTRRAIDAEKALALRAVDWHHPVASPTRCNLYLEGKARIEAGAIDAAVQALLQGQPGADNSDLMALVFEELMQVEGAMASASLLGGLETGELYELASVTSEELRALVDSGELDSHRQALEDFATQVQSHLDSADRASLLDARVERACEAEAVYPIAPLSEDWDCSASSSD